ncbi:MAG: DUF4943 family protein [Bacteroidetes bacterium]|nr:DUF4943 family protein [Bacteroidota bacterium]
MKTMNFQAAIFTMIVLVSCHKEAASFNQDFTVEKYIEQLKANQYNTTGLPEFTYRDIPMLLQYRNDTTRISKIPVNPISSFYQPECSLGMIVLWTIESIRAVANNSEQLIGRFPSQNPILTYRVSDEFRVIQTVESQKIAAKAYFDWWESNKLKNFDAFKNIDPLRSTEFKWH